MITEKTKEILSGKPERKPKAYIYMLLSCQYRFKVYNDRGTLRGYIIFGRRQSIPLTPLIGDYTRAGPVES